MSLEDPLGPGPSSFSFSTPMQKRELLPGTLDMLVLKTLTVQSMHGYGIARHIQYLSNDVLKIEEGSLYPALQRMRQKGWIKAEWRQTPNNQRARYYTITTAGRRQLGVQESSFEELLAAIARVMRPV
jgi:PadR family transcriptional regulator, regulatory protein PadR